LSVFRPSRPPPAARAGTAAGRRNFSNFSNFSKFTNFSRAARNVSMGEVREVPTRSDRRYGRAMTGRLKLLAILCVFGAAASPALAQGAPKSAQLALARQADQLKPGQWVWAPEIAPGGPVLVYVDLGRQLATVYRNGVRIGVSTISSGKDGYETPTGVFTILEKDRDHHSRTYNDASMPFQQRLTWKGVAMHAGNLPGFPASHGCVRLPMEFAKRLFSATPMGGTVVIAGGHEDPVRRAPAGVLAPWMAGVTPVAVMPLAPDQHFSWNPGVAPAGPVSIIVSTGDQQVVVLRGGIEIGRAHAVVAQQTDQPQVMTLAGGAKPQWIQVGVQNLAGDPAEIISTERVEQMHLPAEFVTAMRSVIQPGTTVLVTQASVNAATTGVQTTVMDAEEPAK
jgi:lipoprotein-anchoring transpeptidase ErfK/SrfK